MDTTPADLLKMDGESVADLLEDYADKFALTSTPKVLSVVKSLCVRKGIIVDRKINTTAIPLRRQHVPSQEKLRVVLDGASRRARAAIAIVAFGGQRLGVLGNGRDGLRLGDIVDLRIIENNGKQDIQFEKTPARFLVRAELSKTRKPYFGFLSPLAVQYLENYLRARLEAGELFREKTVVIGAVKHRIRGKDKSESLEGGDQPISTANVSDFIRKALRAGGIGERPYILRSYWAVHADMCTEYPSDWREFNMGHIGNDTVLRTYTLNKELPERKIEAMREAYSKAIKYFDTDEPETVTRIHELEQKLEALKRAQADPKQLTMKEFREQTAVIEALTKAETDAMPEGELVAHAEADDLSEKLEQATDQIAGLEAQLATALEMINNPPKNGNGNAQKIVNEAELEALLVDGWEFVSVLPSGKVVVRREAA
jgi:integrase